MDLLTTSIENSKSLISLTQTVNTLVEENNNLNHLVSELSKKNADIEKEVAEVKNQLVGFKLGCEAMLAPVITAIMNQRK